MSYKEAAKSLQSLLTYYKVAKGLQRDCKAVTKGLQKA